MNPDDLAEALADLPEPLADTVSDLLARGTDRDHLTRLVDAYLRHPEWEADFERALAEEEQPDALADAVVSLLNSGADRTDVRHRLEAFHLQLLAEDRDEDDDVVLDVLDRLTEYSNPHQRL